MSRDRYEYSQFHDKMIEVISCENASLPNTEVQDTQNNNLSSVLWV
jgi:hypothetical protein